MGQTRRLGLAAMRDGRRQAVRRIEPSSRRIVVGPRDGGGGRSILVGETNWLAEPPTRPFRAAVQLRAREAPRPCVITAGDGRATVTLDEPAHAAPGQACVAYDGTRILGGGFILREDRP